MEKKVHVHKEIKVKQHTSRKSHKGHKGSDSAFTKHVLALLVIAAVVLIYNQIQVNALGDALAKASHGSAGSSFSAISGGGDLGEIDLSAIKSTGHTIAAVFPVEEIVTGDDAMAMVFPTGTPDYGESLGVSYDDPVGSLATLAKMYRGLMAEVKKENPAAWDRYLNMATKPLGISCEYCCGVGPIGVRSDGSSSCGCQHNPALLSVGLYLSAYTDYNDAEVLREVMRWKTLFFPKNMIELTTSLAGGDTSALDNLPGMVGGC